MIRTIRDVTRWVYRESGMEKMYRYGRLTESWKSLNQEKRSGWCLRRRRFVGKLSKNRVVSGRQIRHDYNVYVGVTYIKSQSWINKGHNHKRLINVLGLRTRRCRIDTLRPVHRQRDPHKGVDLLLPTTLQRIHER